MADLVCRDPEERLAFVVDAIKDDAWVLHAGGETGNVDRGRIRVREPTAREVFHRILHVLRGSTPSLIAGTLRRIHTHRQRALAVGQIDPCRVPHEHRACAPRDIPRVVHVEVPGERAVLLRPARRVVHLVDAANHDSLIALARLLEPRDLFFCQHVLRVHQLA